LSRANEDFSLRVIARRTSFSLTKGEISTAGFGGASDFGGGVDGVDGSTFELLEEAGEKFATASGFGLPEEPNRRPQFQRLRRKGSQFLRHRRGFGGTASASDSVGGHNVFDYVRDRRAVG